MNDVVQKILIGIGTSLAIAAVYAIYRRWLGPLSKFLRALGGLVNDVAFIKAELQSNGRRSLKDWVAEISDSLSLVDARQRGFIAVLPRATFETDSHFNWIDGNHALERLMGAGFAYLTRRQWLSMIHEADRGGVMDEIGHAVKDKRGAGLSFRILTDDGEVAVRMDASPIFSRVSQDTVICWSGTLTTVNDPRAIERRGP